METALKKVTTKDLFNKDEVKRKFQELLGERAAAFITSVLQTVASNQLLAQAEPHSIYHAAAVAATLDLPLNNQLGFSWIVPYKKNFKDANGNWQSTVLAQFQIGYRGYIQLAQRTAEYRSINVIPVYKNQFKKWDSLREELEADFDIEGEGEIVGYCCFFRLLNGFEKTTFWKSAKLKDHAQRYSKSWNGTKFTGSWETDYDKMAMKTVLANTLKMWGILSIEMKRAIKADQAVIKDSETLDADYVDGAAQPVDKDIERIALMIDDCKTIEELDELHKDVPDTLVNAWLQRKAQISGVTEQPEIFDNVEVNTSTKKSKSA